MNFWVFFLFFLVWKHFFWNTTLKKKSFDIFFFFFVLLFDDVANVANVVALHRNADRQVYWRKKKKMCGGNILLCEQMTFTFLIIFSLLQNVMLKVVELKFCVTLRKKKILSRKKKSFHLEFKNFKILKSGKKNNLNRLLSFLSSFFFSKIWSTLT